MTLNQEIVLACAFRYALGRRTYVVDSVASEIERRACLLPKKDLNLYIKEIDDAISTGAAGMQMDADRWRKCQIQLRAELVHRGV